MPELSHSDSWVWSQIIAPFLCQIQAISTGNVCLGEVAAHKLLSTSVCPCTLNRVSKQYQSWYSLRWLTSFWFWQMWLGLLCVWGVFHPTQQNTALTSDVERDMRPRNTSLTHGGNFLCFLPKPLFADSLRVGFCFDVLLSLKSLVLLLAPVIFGVLWREGGREKK